MWAYIIVEPFQLVAQALSFWFGCLRQLTSSCSSIVLMWGFLCWLQYIFMFVCRLFLVSGMSVILCCQPSFGECLLNAVVLCHGKHWNKLTARQCNSNSYTMFSWWEIYVDIHQCGGTDICCTCSFICESILHTCSIYYFVISNRKTNLS